MESTAWPDKQQSTDRPFAAPPPGVGWGGGGGGGGCSIQGPGVGEPHTKYR